jgi:molecular chaperone GrpE
MEQEELNKEEVNQEEITNEAEATVEDTVVKLEKELAESKDKYIRLYSEFDNFRKRTAKEKMDIILNASENLMKELLPILDDFERARGAFEKSDDFLALKEGVDLIHAKLVKTLESKGLKAIEAKDLDFDVDKHESVTQFPAGDDKKGKVIEELEKGYYLNDKVIRYAKVVVGN